MMQITYGNDFLARSKVFPVFCASLQLLDDQIKNKDTLIAFFDSQGIICREFVSSRQTVDRVLL